MFLENLIIHQQLYLILQKPFRLSFFVGGVKKTAIKELIIVDPDGKTQIYKLNAIFTKHRALSGSIIYAPRDIGRLKGINYAATVSPILSSLALTLASLNSIND